MSDIDSQAGKVVESLKESESTLQNDVQSIAGVRKKLEKALKRARDEAGMYQALQEARDELESCGLVKEILAERRARALARGHPESGRTLLIQTINLLSEAVEKKK